MILVSPAQQHSHHEGMYEGVPRVYQLHYRALRTRLGSGERLWIFERNHCERAR